MHEAPGPSDSSSPAFEAVVRERMSRRGALGVLAVLGGGAAGVALGAGRVSAHDDPPSPYPRGELRFDALPLNNDDQVSTAVGFKHDVVISWGDPVVPGAPAFDIENQTAATQTVQFGFNNDYVDFRPLPYGSSRSKRGLLWVNHEYTSANMMFPGVTYAGFNSASATSSEQKLIEIEAHGGSIVEVRLDRDANAWSFEPSSPYNRRLTGSTLMQISGPAAGNVHLQTNADPTGTTVKGMFNNCGGGNTPWGTIVTAEENFDQYFSNRESFGRRYPGEGASLRRTPRRTRRCSVSWPDEFPRFRTRRRSLRHAGSNGTSRSGSDGSSKSIPTTSHRRRRSAPPSAASSTRLPPVSSRRARKYVVYMGDDQAGQFIYKFVSADKVSNRRERNADLLDSGTLYVATFNADGTGVWKPLTFGVGPLVAPTFEDQADVLIRTRNAAAAVGATPMDRPEDVEVNPVTGYVYAAMTGTSRATADAANPRKSDVASDPDSARGGHVIEIREDRNDHTSTSFRWEIFMLCGNPNAGGTLDALTQPAAANLSGRTYFAGFDESQVSPIARPDNVAFDNRWQPVDHD